MFASTKLQSFTSALFIYALSVAATQELTLKLTGTELADGVDNLKVLAKLTNTGDETLQVLNDPRSVLTSTPTNSFVISDDDGASPSFNGMKLKYSPRRAARVNGTNTFTILTPGDSVEVEHDLSYSYNFTLSGQSSYNIVPSRTFYVADPETLQVSRLKAKLETTHRSRLQGRLAVSRRASNSRVKRCDDCEQDDDDGPSFQGCSAKQKRQIKRAVKAATHYATKAFHYLGNHTESTERFETWFGNYSKTQHSTVLEHYTNMVNQGYGNYTYDCNTCDQEDTFAYVYTEDFGTIYLCSAFWAAKNTGTDSRGGTLVHESSHFTQIAGTSDNAYGQEDAMELALEDPDMAVDNADSHEYFVENHPHLD
ncbi:peptidyl-Lys metalloendopeptidase [Dendrothele bispora CBS 962.96]|uniref:Peptidyl-Lys metalloendopeptidase n=1 Tax=Dendrothele bispora (strain CBS 962.96) TaxID=1314807 RepID=A0A4S8LLI5_DENBC|nr:peptidyl-Lys metalloendopeptidase [Dendrothele bispora CBS 962.96]